MAQSRPDLIRRFFTDLYGEAVAKDAALVLWTARDSRSYWTSSIEDAVEVSGRLSTASDLYFGVNLQSPEAALAERRERTGREADASGLSYTRGYASTVTVMPGLWLDVDVASAAHEKLNLPKTHEEAWAIIEKLPHSPSAKVTTGGGFHLYWLFREPWVIESEEERIKAASLVKGWQKYIIGLSNEQGLAMDSTHDLPRILRPAGTINFKYGFEVQYEYCEPMVLGPEGQEPSRYNPSDFEDYAVEAKLPLKVTQWEIDGVEGLSEDSSPRADKLKAMLNLVPQFLATWTRQRTEFPSGKNSQSEYDMALATMAAKAGWSRQEVCSLIVKHRRDAGEPLKIDHPKYYPLLILKAFSREDPGESLESIEQRVDAISYGTSSIEEEKPGLLEDLSALLGIPIVSIIKYVSDPPQYRLILEGGPIHLGGVENIINSAKFRAAIASVSGTLIRRFKADKWDPVAQAILNAVEEQDLGADSSAEGLVSEWLTEYLTSHRPSEERVDAIQIQQPFFDPEGVVAFFLAQFKQWLGFHRDEKMSRRQISMMLRTAGLEPRTVSYRRPGDGRGSSVSVWCVTPQIQRCIPGLVQEKQDELALEN